MYYFASGKLRGKNMKTVIEILDALGFGFTTHTDKLNKLVTITTEKELDDSTQNKIIHTILAPYKVTFAVQHRASLEITERFGAYRRPTDTTIPKYRQIQEKTMELAVLFDALCPDSEEKKSAFTLLQQAKMSANAAIAIYTKES